jgi:hypothetical protein
MERNNRDFTPVLQMTNAPSTKALYRLSGAEHDSVGQCPREAPG